MKNIAKKIAIYTMVGIMQIGFGASVIEASPLYYGHPSIQQYDRHDRFEHERHERERIENERHNREMRRYPNETLRHWHERQRHEMERHKRALYDIRHGR